MAALPSLKHYSLYLTTANTWLPVHTVLPAGRALAISKITVTASATCTFYLGIGASATNGGQLVINGGLTNGGVYTESGLIAITGECVNAWCSATNTIVVNVFGEEVDN